MGALVKYEFRKSWKMKIFVLCFTVFFELVFLFGVWRMNDRAIGISVTGLAFTTICGMFLIGVYGIHVLSKDINTTQSYMLFMTPNSSYKILGAKVLEGCGSFFVSGVFFILLAILDMAILALRYDDMETIFNLISMVYTGDVGQFNYLNFTMTTLDMVMSCLYLISLGFLAVVACATFLKGNKFNGLFSFVAFILLSLGINKIHDAIYGEIFIFSVEKMVSNLAFYALLTCVIYLITAWIMDNKLSV